MTTLAMPGGADLPARNLAVQLLSQAHAEYPALADVGQREQLLAAAWLVGYRSARTRRAYAGDFVAWLGWLGQHQVDVLAARRVHVDLWVYQQREAGAAASTINRRLPPLAGFYRHAAAHDLITGVPNETSALARGAVDWRIG